MSQAQFAARNTNRVLTNKGHFGSRPRFLGFFIVNGTFPPAYFPVFLYLLLTIRPAKSAQYGIAVIADLWGWPMAITDIPIFSMLRTRLEWSQERQRVLAQNVANSDTPNYRARDLVPPKFGEQVLASPASVAGVKLARTESGHFAGVGLSSSAFSSEAKANYELRPTGNAVNLEEEMMKVAANQMDYQTASALYTRSLNLIKTALGKR